MKSRTDTTQPSQRSTQESGNTPDSPHADTDNDCKPESLEAWIQKEAVIRLHARIAKYLKASNDGK